MTEMTLKEIVESCEPGEYKIRVARNNCIVNDPCTICGGRCDPCGFDYFLGDSLYLVCDACAETYSPELVKMRSEALAFADREDHVASMPLIDEPNDLPELSIRRALGYIPTACEICGAYYDPQWEWEIYADREVRRTDHPEQEVSFWFVCEKCAKKRDLALYAVWLQIRDVAPVQA